MINKGAATEADRSQLSSDRAEVEQQITAFNNQLQILNEKRQKLQRMSPISGTVTTWDVEKNLVARPVVTGQVLMTIADPTGNWDVEVYMPEKRMKFLDEAFANTEKDYLPCEFILKTAPDDKRTGKLYRQSVHQRAEIHGEDGTTVKLRIVPDTMDGITRRPGAEVIADVKCGKRSFAYVWTHEIIAWIRSYLLF
jgi:hypothetical protein